MYARKTQQAVPDGTHKASFPVAAAFLPLNIVPVIFYLGNLNSLHARSSRICINISYQYPNNSATFGLCGFAVCWRKVYGDISNSNNDATIL